MELTEFPKTQPSFTYILSPAFRYPSLTYITRIRLIEQKSWLSSCFHSIIQEQKVQSTKGTIQIDTAQCQLLWKSLLADKY